MGGRVCKPARLLLLEEESVKYVQCNSIFFPLYLAKLSGGAGACVSKTASILSIFSDDHSSSKKEILFYVFSLSIL